MHSKLCMNLLSPAIFIVLLFLFGLIILELAARYTKISHVIIRKIGHVGLSLTIAGLAYFLGSAIFIPIGFGFFVVALVLRRFGRLRSVSDFSTSYGEILFPLGLGVTALLAQSTPDFITCLLILGLADTAAFIIGRHIKSPKLVFNKTLAGSSAFFVVAAIIIYLSTGNWLALPAALLLAIIELDSPRGSDNFTVPVATGLLLNIISFLA